MNHISSYSSIYAIGHKAILDIFETPVLIEEKIDGSQFSFGDLDGELCCRSKGKDMIMDAPEKMFDKAVQTVVDLQSELQRDWVYRGEFLQKPKHNSLTYNRVPEKNIILFDVMIGPERYLGPEEKAQEAARLGLEVVPVLFEGMMTSFEMFKEFLNWESILGGVKIEGVVVKNYNMFTQEKKVAMGKYVSEAFKEIHTSEWKKSNPTGKDIIEELIMRLKTDARWDKAIQHLRDAGELDGSPKDIGPLLKEIQLDIQKECTDDIKDILFKHYWKDIARGVVRGLPEWYKDKLGMGSFKEE